MTRTFYHPKFVNPATFDMGNNSTIMLLKDYLISYKGSNVILFKTTRLEYNKPISNISVIGKVISSEENKSLVETITDENEKKDLAKIVKKAFKLNPSFWR